MHSPAARSSGSRPFRVLVSIARPINEEILDSLVNNLLGSSRILLVELTPFLFKRIEPIVCENPANNPR
jgi:hypothetical protein